MIFLKDELTCAECVRRIRIEWNRNQVWETCTFPSSIDVIRRARRACNAQHEENSRTKMVWPLATIMRRRRVNRRNYCITLIEKTRTLSWTYGNSRGTECFYSRELDRIDTIHTLSWPAILRMHEVPLKSCVSEASGSHGIFLRYYI